MSKQMNNEAPRKRKGLAKQEGTSATGGLSVQIDPSPAQPDDPLRMIGGSRSTRFNSVMLRQVMGTVWIPSGPHDGMEQRMAAVAAALAGFKPRDEIEGMLAGQAVALHFGAMECLRRAMIADQPAEIATKLRKDGANLCRAMTDMLDALDRKRGKGRQHVVRVERVQVAPGGQAIVGNVQAGAALGREQHGEGLGHDGQTRGEPHAPPAGLAHDASLGTILPPMRSTDAGRDAVPVARDGQRAVQDARGR